MDWEKPQDSRYWPAVGEMMIRLDMLSDAPTSKAGVATGINQGKPESKPPTGPKPPKGDECPSPNENLYEFYRWHFLKAQTDKRILDLLAEAEHDYAHYRGTAPKPRGKDGNETEPEFQDRIVAMYEGVDAARVARFETCRVQVVLKARRVKKRDEESGRPSENFRHLDERGRIALIRKLRGQGLNKEQASARVGVTVRTLTPIWSRSSPLT